MDTNLIVGYAALLLAFLALLATVFNKKRSKALIIITAVLVITSVTFVLWRPLKTAIHEALIFPEGVVIIDEETDETDETEDVDGMDETEAMEATDAWGPKDRETFTWDKPATYTTFNSMTDNPSLGHESNFVRIREADTKDIFTDDVEIEAGKEYDRILSVQPQLKDHKGTMTLPAIALYRTLLTHGENGEAIGKPSLLSFTSLQAFPSQTVLSGPMQKGA